MKHERYFAIGDLHGHYTEFMQLLELLRDRTSFHLRFDHLVLLGDLVDSGTQTKQLLDYVIDLKEKYPQHLHVVKGNHEDMLLDALSETHPKYGDYYIWYNQGGEATLKSYTDGMEANDYEKAIMQPADLIPQKHLAFIRDLPLYYETEEYFFCHAGLRPGTKISDTDFTDPKVQDDLIWIRDEFFLSDFDFGKTVVFGHTSFEDRKRHIINGIFVKEGRIGINTMPRNTGRLTAIQLPKRKFYQVGNAMVTVKKKKEVSENAQEQENEWQNRD